MLTVKFDGKQYHVSLIDDGSMDTVVKIAGVVCRFDAEYAAEFRNTKGIMTDAGLRELALVELDTNFQNFEGREVR